MTATDAAGTNLTHCPKLVVMDLLTIWELPKPHDMAIDDEFAKIIRG